MNLSFENKVALVTGAGSGMGLATAQAFATEGAAVVLADVNEAAARAATEQLVAAGHKAIAVRCEVADEGQVKAMVDQTVSAFGRLDAAFNNAGVQSPIAETADASGEEFDRVCDQSPRRLELHEIRAAPDVRARKWRHRQLLFDRRTRGHSRAGNVSRLQARGARTDQKRRSRIRLQGHPYQCCMPWDHRYADGYGHAGQGTRRHERDHERSADRTTWSAGGDRW